MPVKETVELSNHYGLSNVLVIILILTFIAVFYTMLRWVIKLNQTMVTSAHEEKMALAALVNTGMKGITDALNQNTLVCQEIMRNVKDGFELMRKADDYHRADIKDIRNEVMAVKDAVVDNGCQFFESKKSAA